MNTIIEKLETGKTEIKANHFCQSKEGNVQVIDERVKPKELTTWTGDKSEFIESLKDGSFYITKDGTLIDEVVIEDSKNGGEEFNIVHEIYVGDTSYSTHRLRQFCDEFHPEFDLQTDEQGVYARYQESFGHDYEEWVQNQIYEELAYALKERGFMLTFNKNN